MTNHNGKEFTSFESERPVDPAQREGKTLAEVAASLHNTLSDPTKVIPMNYKDITYVPMLTIRSNALRNQSANFCGVEVAFNGEGLGTTPSYNREYIEQYQNLRQGFISIVSDEAFETKEPPVLTFPGETFQGDVTGNVEPVTEEELTPLPEAVVDELLEGTEEVVAPKRSRGRPKQG